MMNIYLKYFADLIEKDLGIVYEDSNAYQLTNRLEQVAQTLAAKSVEDLYLKAQAGQLQEIRLQLLPLACNHESFFFRDSKVFDAIRITILPELLKRKGSSDPLQVWSAACSFGQEPYSLAILLHEVCLQVPHAKFNIFATDVSESALSRAQIGEYSEFEAARGLSKSLSQKYFQQKNLGTICISPEIRKCITFKQMNLKNIPQDVNKFDLILCRNVLIYQRVESKAKIIRNLSQHLAPGGLLLLGAGESLLGISEDFTQVFHEGAVFYQLKAA